MLRRVIKATRIAVVASMCAMLHLVVLNSTQTIVKWLLRIFIDAIVTCDATRLNIWIFWWDMNFLLAFPKSFDAIWIREKKKRFFHATQCAVHDGTECADFTDALKMLENQAEHFSCTILLPLSLSARSYRVVEIHLFSKHSTSGVAPAGSTHFLHSHHYYSLASFSSFSMANNEYKMRRKTANK